MSLPTSDSSEVPTWPAFLPAVLEVLSTGETLHRKDLFDRAAKIAELSASARAETLSTGGLRYEQRLTWATTNAARAGLLHRPQRAHYSITEKGKAFRAEHPGPMSYGEARVYFAPYWPKATTSSPGSTAQLAGELDSTADLVADPIETIEAGIRAIEEQVAEELTTRLRESHPSFFEQAVVDLLLEMGYGGAEQRGRRIGGSGDGGVDGVIDQDALGLDRIYIQAKRYAEGNNIGRETIQAFVGALHGLGATRGVFITTSAFTPGAISYAESVPSSIVLIDAERLATLMIKYRVGVQITKQYDVIGIDSDFFD